MGCNRDKTSDQTVIDKEEKILVQSNQKNHSEKMNLEDLKEKLLGSVGVELKNTDNQAIGLLKEREEIFNFVEELFQHPQQEKFPNDSKGNTVIGPINFYFSDDEDLYGIVKDSYIYIEGYYFLMSQEDIDDIEKMFRNNIIEAPVSGN